MDRLNSSISDPFLFMTDDSECKYDVDGCLKLSDTTDVVIEDFELEELKSSDDDDFKFEQLLMKNGYYCPSSDNDNQAAAGDLIISQDDLAACPSLLEDATLSPTPMGGTCVFVPSHREVPISESVLSCCDSYIAMLKACTGDDCYTSNASTDALSSMIRPMHHVSSSLTPTAAELVVLEDSRYIESRSSSSFRLASPLSRSCSPDLSDDSASSHSLQWNKRYQDLMEYHRVHGHCSVPYKVRGPLSEWVKRQRHQFKLKVEGRHSNLSDKRQAMLEALGFVWDSRAALWNERFQELVEFRNEYGHVRVTQKTREHRALAVWLKRQRHACRSFLAGDRSTGMMEEKLSKLVDIGVNMNLDSVKKRS